MTDEDKPREAAGGAPVYGAVAAGALALFAGAFLTSEPVDGESPTAETEQSIPVEPPSPPPLAERSAAPTGGPAVAQTQTSRGVQIAQLPAPRPEIVVKFKGDSRVREICQLFWKDPEAARAKFQALKSDLPGLEALSLDRVTYSDELVLVHDGAAPREQVRRALLDAAKRLQGDPNVSYAEPNATAQAGDK